MASMPPAEAPMPATGNDKTRVPAPPASVAGVAFAFTCDLRGGAFFCFARGMAMSSGQHDANSHIAPKRPANQVAGETPGAGAPRAQVRRDPEQSATVPAAGRHV